MIRVKKFKEQIDWRMKVNPIDILVYLWEKKRPVTWTELEDAFVKTGGDMHISTQTLSTYLKFLLSRGLIVKEIDQQTLKAAYCIKNPAAFPSLSILRNMERKIIKAFEKGEFPKGLIHTFEYAKLDFFIRAQIFLNEFKRDFYDFKIAILTLLNQNNISDEKIKTLIEWAECRLIKEQHDIIEMYKTAFSALDIKFDVIWPEEKIDISRQLIKEHESIIKQTKKLVSILKKCLEIKEKTARKECLKKIIEHLNINEYFEGLNRELEHWSAISNAEHWVGEAYYLLSWEQDKRKIQEHLALMEKWIHEFKLDEELRKAKKDKLLEKIQSLQNQLKNKLGKK
jgi:hypothetical protein